VDTQRLEIIAEERSNEGIAKTFEAWKQGGRAEKDRAGFYLEIIRAHVDALQKKASCNLHQLPLILSGMASSSIGIIELPYKEMPFSADGSDLELRVMGNDNVFDEVVIVSGAKTTREVMRGEETQLVGCFDSEKDGEEMIFVFPGTHSKHVLVKGGKAVDLKTYMTGEFFRLLSEKSILSTSIQAREHFGANEHRKSFEDGVRTGAKTNLLQSSFQIRTNDLFGTMTGEENYFYLSGLLIGTEIKELMASNNVKITLVCNQELAPFYEAAFNVLNPQNSTLAIIDADGAAVKGQYKIYQRVLNEK